MAPWTRTASPLPRNVDWNPPKPASDSSDRWRAAQVQEIAQRDVGLGEAGPHVAVAEHDEVVGPFKRQRPQQHGLDDGKQRRVRADAQRERHDGGCRKGRLAPEDPKRLAKVTHHMDALDDASEADVVRRDGPLAWRWRPTEIGYRPCVQRPSRESRNAAISWPLRTSRTSPASTG